MYRQDDPGSQKESVHRAARVGDSWSGAPPRSLRRQGRLLRLRRCAPAPL